MLETPSRPIVDSLEKRRFFAVGFQISLTFSGDLLEPAYQAYQASFVTAAARWTSILTEDIPDVGSGPWGGPVDDLRIEAAAVPIDGVGNTLGGAQYFYRRTTGARLPINGSMEFDTADLNATSIVDVITHEMGHVLGIGSLWSSAGIVQDYGGADPQFTGVAALAEYRASMGNLLLASVPVENTGAQGTRDVHWRETTFGRELMTGFYNGGQANPLSRMSAASLIDLGYPGVNPDAAQTYTPTGGNPQPTVASVTPSLPTSHVGGTFTLTANTVADVTGGVADVRFYRESNGIPGLQASGNVTTLDTLINTDSAGPVYSANVSLGALPEGDYTYYAQVTDTFGAKSIYKSATHTISIVPTAPSTPDLDSASDSGSSTTDNITNDATPTFKGTSVEAVGTTIRVFADGVEIGQTSVAADSSWTFTAPTLANGVRVITAKADTGVGISNASPALNVTIDTVAPTIASSAFIYATMLGVTFGFSESVSASLDSGDLVFINTTDSINQPSSYVGSIANVATFVFGGATPPRGNYVAMLSGAGVSDVAGNVLTSNATVNFAYIPGDINRSGSVNFDDLLILIQHYGQTGTFADGDINYSGAINFNDLLILTQNYGQSLLSFSISAPVVVSKRSRGEASRVIV